MRRERGAMYAALASALLSVLLAIAVNVGTGGRLPGPLDAVAWLAWPLVGVLTALTVWLAVRDERRARSPTAGAAAEAPAPRASAGTPTAGAGDLPARPPAAGDPAGPPPADDPAGRPAAGARSSARSSAAGARSSAPDFPTRPPPAQLPAIDHHTGRAADLDKLRTLVDRGRRVIVVSGAPGIGKSTLAARLAHDLAADFPDGQLVDGLGGGSGIVAAPEEVLTRFLEALDAGLTGPADLARLAAHFRSVLAGRRVLVLLDDARDAAQVRPLLPGAPGCLTLVTSRSALADLVPAVTYEVGGLTTDDALALLRDSGADDRVDAEPTAAAEVVAACGALPLALQVAGAKFRKRPVWTLADLAARLRDERDRLDELNEGALDVRASFAAVYKDLPDADRRAFRALGAYPGRDLPAGAAAALTGDPGAAERLVDARLLDAVAVDRYRLHDLMRLFARERLAGAGGAALGRLVDWYVAVLPAASADWIDDEVDNIALTVRAALDRDRPADALRLAVAADVPVLHRAEQRAFLRICRDRRRAAELLGDGRAADEALTRLGATVTAYGHVDEGIAMLTTAYRNWRERGDADWTAFTAMSLGNALRDGGRNTEALAHLEEALTHFRAVGDRRREAQALAGLGVTYVNRFDPEAAIEVLEQARTVSATAQMHPQEGVWPILMLATALQQTGRYAEARPLLDRARAGFVDPVNWSGEGHARLELADAADAAGDRAAADEHLAAARAAFGRIDDRPGFAMADRARGHHLARAGAAGAAEQAFERAAALFEELGNPSSAGLDRLWRAEQLFALGQPADAEAEVTRADALLAGSDIPVADLVRARLPTARRPATADDPAPVAAPTPTPVPGPAPASGTGPVPVRESAADRPAPTPGERDGQAPPRT